MIPPVVIHDGGEELLDSAGPLWLELFAHHCARSERYAATHAGFDWPRRRQLLLDKSSDGGSLRVSLAVDGEPVAYCFSTIDARGRGEVESLYVRATHRRLGLGGALVRRHLDWFRGVDRVVVGVAQGNEEAFAFYEALGFRVRVTVLEHLGEREP